jgi:multiple sugar transport system permease protein
MKRFNHSTTYLLMSAVALIFLVPVIWIVLSSFKTEIEYYANVILPPTIHWENYYQALTMAPFFRFLKNSIALSVISCVLTTATSSLVGYAFARLKAPGKNVLFGIVVAMILLPGTALLIPRFILYAKIGFINTYWPWIVGGLSGNAYIIFLFRQFFFAFPKELEDAAEVDGCTRLRIFWQILLPNSMPVLVTSLIFTLMWTWGDYVGPSLYLSPENTTLAVALTGGYYVDPHGMPLPMVRNAAIVIYAIPMVLAFFLAQRYIIQGVVTTGLK